MRSVYSPSQFEAYFESEKDEKKYEPFMPLDIVPEGFRNNYIFRLGCSRLAKGESMEEAQGAMTVENEEKCKPPLKRREMRTIFTSVMKHDEEKAEPRYIKEFMPDCPYQGFKVPRGYEMVSKGIHLQRSTKDGMPIRELICAHSIFMVERLKNIDTKEEKVRLAMWRDNKWSECIVDRAVVSARKDIISLTKQGVMVNSENASKLIAFLGAFEQANMDVLPVKYSISRAGWVNKSNFAP